MKLYDFTGLDTTGRNRLFTQYSCDNCSIEYKKQTRQAVKSKIEHYCSRKCASIADVNNVRIDLTCAHCKKIFNRKKSSLVNSKSGLYFCSRDCKDTAQIYMKEIQPAHYGTGSGVSSYREKAFRFYPIKCFYCSYDNIEALEVHHIDKDRTNNDIYNLQILCANCHTLLHKNKLI